MQNKYINFLIKLGVLIFLFVILYKQLFLNQSFKNAIQHFKISTDGNVYLIYSVIILMIINWSVETIKWKFLIDKIHFISWLDALEGILFGITFSMFTPSRVGEFGGRVFALNSDRIQAIVSTILGSATQLVANISLGVIGFLSYLLIFEKFEKYTLSIVFFLALFLVLLLHICLFNLDIIATKFPKVKQLENIRKYIDIISLYSNIDLLKIELLSVVRYIIYNVQFILLMYYFNIEISILYAVIISMTIFLFQTINPLNIALIDFGFRGNVALFFLMPFTDNSLNILVATIFLWFVNLIIPAIFGGISALRFKFISEEQ
ncbi:MAG: lysylphosphatidylglycerol synthase domain-containing protein [Chitinophagales bacterium]|nr:lysylphosphatidylglycerol synthase domain-containing protein [Chitinophagales bacterium]HNC63992.1 lysylphosphatidylglycerol synthase domain-containing protein [Chitinophagales bacterium]HNM67626.1 lysylphosphatidylglycerol synthase domain-containing protein [Chitinophagales bacterium]